MSDLGIICSLINTYMINEYVHFVWSSFYCIHSQLNEYKRGEGTLYRETICDTLWADKQLPSFWSDNKSTIITLYCHSFQLDR